MTEEHNIKKLFGKRVKELRQKMGLTQEELAERIDVGERNLSKIECGNVFVKAQTIAKLAIALNVAPKELFEFSHYQQHDYIKENMINDIENDKIDVDLLYRIYRSIKH